jgi:hypothetical protein
VSSSSNVDWTESTTPAAHTHCGAGRIALRDCRWPFKQPVVFEAVDGSVVPPPEGWQSGPGAWGCMKSHQLVLDSRDPESDFDTGLQAIFKVTVKDPSVREHQLREWIKSIQWEVATFPRLICTVWHPEATQELVKAASLWRVYPITADSLSCALNQIPHKYRRSHQPILASRFIVHLTAPREVMKELRLHGWHDGHNLDQLTEENLILVRIWQLFTDHQMRIQQLSVALKRLQIEAERRENGLAVVWHHQINSSTVREATSTQVLDIHAETVADALSHLKSAIPNAIYIESKIQSCSNCQS